MSHKFLLLSVNTVHTQGLLLRRLKYDFLYPCPNIESRILNFKMLFGVQLFLGLKTTV